MQTVVVGLYVVAQDVMSCLVHVTRTGSQVGQQMSVVNGFEVTVGRAVAVGHAHTWVTSTTYKVSVSTFCVAKDA